MRHSLIFALMLTAGFSIFAAQANADDNADAKTPLEGAWQPFEVTIEGTLLPKELVEKTTFTFKGKELSVIDKSHGENHPGESGQFSVDDEQSPKHLTLTKAGEEPVLGIYKIDGDELTICVRREASDGGRPTEFESKPESGLMLMKLKRQ